MTTIQKWGNSLAVRIPRSAAREAALEEGTPVELIVENGEVVVRPMGRRKYALSDLLKNCRPSQLHGETDWGDDVGREVLD
jgi:antitoxin MazE